MTMALNFISHYKACWEFLIITHKLEEFIVWVGIFYQHAVFVIINGFRSDPVHTGRRTKHGELLLFYLVAIIESLECAISKSASIQEGQEIKLVLYADNTLLFLSNLEQAAPETWSA